MFTHMRFEKMDVHSAHGNKYELQVYLVEEISEYRIYISKENDRVGDVFSAKYEVVKDARNTNSLNNIDVLIEVAKNDINRNEFGIY
jgi:NAD(P)H-flavin reductase